MAGLVKGDASLDLNFHFYVLDGIGGHELQGGRVSGKSHHKRLYSTMEDTMERGSRLLRWTDRVLL
jgi:hypothetical protein